MSSVSLNTTNNKITVVAPYNPDMVKAAKALDGKFIANSWNFPLSKQDEVLSVLLEVYGYSEEGKDDLVDVRIHLATNGALISHRSSIILAGREIARAYSRDSGAKLGVDINIVRGSFKSSGSAQNWDTRSTNGAVFEIKNLYRHAAKNIQVMYGWSANIAKLEILETNTSSEDELIQEITNQIQASVTEIEAVRTKMEELISTIQEQTSRQNQLLEKLRSIGTDQASPLTKGH